VRKIKNKFRFAENIFNLFVNCGSIVSCPPHYPIESRIEAGGIVNQTINVARLIS